MTDLDLERLGDVWRQQPDPAELEQLQRTAANVRRRARFANVVDLAAAALVSLVVILLILSNPNPRTLILGVGAILLLLIGQMRQRTLRQFELRALTGTTEDMLDQSIDRVEATVKRMRFGLIVMGPGFVLGWLFMNAVTEAPALNYLPDTFDNPLVRSLWAAAFVAVLVASAFYLALVIRRGRRELERLRAMREAYRQEQRSTGA